MSDEEETDNKPDQVDRLIQGARNLLHERDQKPTPRWTLSTIATLVALVLSVTTATWTLYERFLAKPSPELIADSIVNIYCNNRHRDGKYECREPSSPLLIRSGPLTFLNQSVASNNFWVSDGSVTVNFLLNRTPSRDPIKLRWQYFSDATDSSIERTSVSPFQVPTAVPVSREIEFYPRRDNRPDGTVNFENRLPFRDFLELVGQNVVDEVRLNFRFTIYPNKEDVEATCSIRIGEDFVRNAIAGKHVLYSRDCFS